MLPHTPVPLYLPSGMGSLVMLLLTLLLAILVVEAGEASQEE